MSGAPWWEEFRAAQVETPAPRAETPASRGAPAAAPPVVPTPAPTPEPAAAGATSVRGPRRPSPGDRALKVLAAVLGVVLLALVGILGARLLSSGGDASGTAVSSTSPTAGGPTTPRATAQDAATPGGTAAAAARAEAELEAMRDAGLAAHTPDGQWVAQLAAKSIGTTDPVQTAANGSSTFYAADILAQSRTIASGVAGGDVFVLRSTDFGEASVDARGNPFWVTFAAGPFGDADDVRTWCDSVFAATPAADRGNVCFPKQLLSPR